MCMVCLLSVTYFESFLAAFGSVKITVLFNCKPQSTWQRKRWLNWCMAPCSWLRWLCHCWQLRTDSAVGLCHVVVLVLWSTQQNLPRWSTRFSQLEKADRDGVRSRRVAPFNNISTEQLMKWVAKSTKKAADDNRSELQRQGKRNKDKKRKENSKKRQFQSESQERKERGDEKRKDVKMLQIQQDRDGEGKQGRIVFIDQCKKCNFKNKNSPENDQ